jgi:hypothetical protein
MRLIVTVVWVLMIWPFAPLAQDGPPPGILGREAVLSLREAELLALENNRGLVIARTFPQVAATLERQAEGAFDPLGFAGYGFEHLEDPVVSRVQSFFDIDPNDPNSVPSGPELIDVARIPTPGWTPPRASPRWGASTSRSGAAS